MGRHLGKLSRVKVKLIGQIEVGIAEVLGGTPVKERGDHDRRSNP
jgi:hypothetical protein